MMLVQLHFTSMLKMKNVALFENSDVLYQSQDECNTDTNVIHSRKLLLWTIM
jgi:hypothetical protein